MDENIKNTKDSSKEKNPAREHKAKGKSPFMRILVLVLVICVAVFSAIIISDLIVGNDKKDSAEISDPEYITLSVSGSSVLLDGKELSVDSLRAYLEAEKEKGITPVTAFIIDSQTPGDYVVFNQVLDLLSEYGINVDVERMQPPSTADELSLSTKDEVLR